MDTRDEQNQANVDQTKANVILTKAQAIRQLRDAGYDPESVVKAVAAGDVSLVKTHAAAARVSSS